MGGGENEVVFSVSIELPCDVKEDRQWTVFILDYRQTVGLGDSILLDGQMG